MNSITKDFNGLPIVFREDGYINMTKAAEQFPGKRIDNFWANEETRQYIQAMDDFLIPSISSELIQSKKGRHGGTFCHPKLAVFFARWLDVRFAVWCDLMIDNILRGNIQTSVAIPTQEAVDVNAVVAPFKARIMELGTPRLLSGTSKTHL